jgi:hypothetical protein
MKVDEKITFSESECAAEVLRAVERERRRIVGMVLQRFGVARAAGTESIAHALDALATDIEHS